MDQTMQTPESEPKGNGALVGAVIVVLLLIIGGVYFWKTNMKKEVAPPAPEQEDVGDMGGEGVSAEGNLEANLNSVDLDSLDEGL
ncbi:MAG: hypothetical protein AAB500_00315 [Patescibacteria group bacterium]